MLWLMVGIGGALGSMARHGVNLLFAHRLLRLEPYGTAAINISGSLVIGLLAGAIAGGHLHLSPQTRTLLFVGVLGGFTTFSTLMLDTFTFVEGGRVTAALLNLSLQIVLGYTAAYAGFRLATGGTGL